jgi:GT2 family glycosyltransferase
MPLTGSYTHEAVLPIHQVFMPSISVIIPTHNKASVLNETLRGLEQQNLPHGTFEVIVVDDGSTDGTREWLEAQARARADGTGSRRAYPLTVLSQANQGAAAARNAGAAAAAGDILLFLDADIVAAAGLVAAHLRHHEGHEASVMIGRFLVPAGALAAYRVFGRSFDLGPEPRTLVPGLGLAGQTSIRKDDFQRIGGFKTGWPRAEDVEFSRRAVAQGLQIHYCPEAVAYHNHALSLDQLVHKEFDNHVGLVPYLASQPDAVQDFPYLAEQWPLAWGADAPRLVLRKLARAALATPPARAALYALCAAAERTWPAPAVMDFLVWKLLGTCQWKGLREGMRECGWRPDDES